MLNCERRALTDRVEMLVQGVIKIVERERKAGKKDFDIPAPGGIQQSLSSELPGYCKWIQFKTP